MPAPLSGVTHASRIEGGAELSRKLDDLGGAFNVPILRAAVRAGIEPAYLAAQRNIPVGDEAHRTYKGRLVAPGFSQRSLRVVTRVSQDRKTVSAALGVRKEAFYAIVFTELGTSKMRARPWLRRSMRETQAQQQAAFAQKVRDRIAKVTQK